MENALQRLNGRAWIQSDAKLSGREKMLIRQLNVFLTVCRTGSMTAAAEELYMTQPAVSQTIRDLEMHYETKLFDRYPRRLEITEAGRTLRRSAERLLENLEEMEITVRDNNKNGPVRIGVNLSVGNALLMQYLQEFRKRHPDSAVNVFCTRGQLLEQMLNDHELDFLMMEKPMHDNDYSMEPFYEDRIVIVTRPDDPLLQAKDLVLADLAAMPFLLRERGAGVREQFDHICLSKGLRIKPYWESSSTTVLVNAVLAGEGIAVVPYLMVRDRLADGVIRELTVTDVTLSRTLYLIRNHNKYLPESVKDFIRVVLEGRQI